MLDTKVMPPLSQVGKHLFVPAGRSRKPVERAEARRLRRELGLPMKRIAARLGVSQASVSLWTRDIELTPEQKRRNLVGPGGPCSPEVIARAVARSKATSRERRRRYQEDGRRRARAGDPMHQAGCMLFWAEGSKHRNDVVFVNSDVDMVRFFSGFLRRCFGLTPEDFTVRLNVYTSNGLTVHQIEDYWLGALDLHRSCLRKHTLNHRPTSSSGQKRNKIPYGVCALRVRKSTRIVQHIYGAIQEYAGFEEPRWLG